MAVAGLIVASTVAYSFRLQSFMHAKELVWALGTPVVVIIGWRVWTLDGVRLCFPLWLGITLVFVLHALLSPAQLSERVVETTLRYALVLAVAAVFVDVTRTPRCRMTLEWAFIGSAIVVGALAIAQFAGWLRVLFPVFPHYDQRVYSVFGNQDLLGGYMALGVVAILACIGHKRRPWHWAALPIVVAALLLSGSRSAWLGAGVGLVLLLAFRDTRRSTARALVVAVLPIALAVCLLVPEATVARWTGSFGSGDVGALLRLWVWDGTMRMIGDHFWWGVGPGNFAYWSPRYLGEALAAYHTWQHAHNEVHTIHAESEWLERWAEMGLLAPLCLIWQIARVRDFRGHAWAILAAFGVFACLNTVSHSMPHVLWALFLIAGMDAPQRDLDAHADDDHIPYDRGAFLTLTALALIVGAGLVVTSHIPSLLLRRAERAEPMQPRLYDAAMDYPWPSADAPFAYGMALFGAGEHDAAYGHLLRATRVNDTGALHLALAILADERGDGDRATHHAREALQRWPFHAAAGELHRRYTPYGSLK